MDKKQKVVKKKKITNKKLFYRFKDQIIHEYLLQDFLINTEIVGLGIMHKDESRRKNRKSHKTNKYFILKLH